MYIPLLSGRMSNSVKVILWQRAFSGKHKCGFNENQGLDPSTPFNQKI